MKALKNYISLISVLSLMIIVPLYIDNAYFNAIEAKFGAFFLCMVIIIPMIIISSVISGIKNRRIIPKDFSLLDTAILLFAVSTLVSTLLSRDISASIFGSSGWYVGAFTVTALCILYFFVSKNYSYGQNIWLPIYAVNIFIAVIGLCQFAGLDLLGYSQNILPKQYFQYISTFGNTNWYTGYLCLLLPMASVFFIGAKSAFSYYSNLIFIIFATSNVLIIITDGVYIGLGICFIIAIPFVFKTAENLRRSSIIGGIFALEALIIELLPIYSDLRDKASGLCAFALDIRVSLAFLAIFTGVYILCRKGKLASEKIRNIISRILLCLSLAMLVCAFLYIILTFSDSFGSHRGLIWRVSLEKFGGFSLKEKLFGIGPEMLRGLYPEVETVFEGLAVISAHSETIQILLSMGIFGIAAYLFVIVCCIIGFVKKGYGEIRSLAYFLPLCGYFGQSFINSATTANLCLLCTVLIFYRQSIEEQGDI